MASAATLAFAFQAAEHRVDARALPLTASQVHRFADPGLTPMEARRVRRVEAGPQSVVAPRGRAQREPVTAGQ